MRPFQRLFVLAAIGLIGGLLATPGASADASGLRAIVVRHSLLGTHSWYVQTFRGIPVLGSFYGKHVIRDGSVSVDDGRQAIGGSPATIARVTAAAAMGSARSAGAPRSASLAILPGSRARLVWSVLATRDGATVRALVDAATGALVRVDHLVKNVDGSGQVFAPNPVVALQDESLTDHNDADFPGIQPAYKTKTLTHLGSSGRLRGAFAYIVNATANEPTFQFIYNRRDDRFEEVQSYYSITSAQEYIQSLGFNDVNNEPQDLKPNGITIDNSFYDPATDMITYGSGGVDDAEDDEVIWHEYGHAIQDAQVPGFGSTTEAGSIGEGFGDYWGVTMAEPNGQGFDDPCVADWDATSYDPTVPHCLRRTDENLTIDDINGEVHHDGQIWSRALWDIHQRLGRETTDTIILESQFLFAPNTTFKAAAIKTITTARTLFGQNAAKVCRRAFHARKII
jgi:Zn-dependent metalloprotease